jgi:hypothetical protein
MEATPTVVPREDMKTNPLKKKTKRSIGGDGFTVLEIIIAFSVLMIGFVASMALHLGSLNGWSASQDTSDGSEIARRTLEILRIEADQWRAAGTDPSIGASILADSYIVDITGSSPFHTTPRPLRAIEAAGAWEWVQLTDAPINNMMSESTEDATIIGGRFCVFARGDYIVPQVPQLPMGSTSPFFAVHIAVVSLLAGGVGGQMPNCNVIQEDNLDTEGTNSYDKFMGAVMWAGGFRTTYLSGLITRAEHL